MPVIRNKWQPIMIRTNQIRVITLFASNAVKEYCLNWIATELAVKYENRRWLIPFSDVISNPNYFIWNHIGKELREWSLWLVIFDSFKFCKIFNTNIFVQRLIFGSYVYKLYNETTRKCIWHQAFTVPEITEITYSPGHRQFCLYGFLQYDWSSQNQNKEIWPKGAGATYTLCTKYTRRPYCNVTTSP